ncbi:MAG: extracellular solute-binding protein [Elusimicrobia bacterium]|nr:extracellular solute-binding protein [Elusimicrobiota bacterium]
MLFWLLSDVDAGKFLALKKLISRFSIEQPDADIQIAVKTKKSMWNALFAHLRDPANNPVADLLEIPAHWTTLFAKLGVFLEIKNVYEEISLDKYFAFLKSGCVLSDTEEIFSIPWWMEIYALILRDDMAGSGFDAGTWSGFLESIEDIRRKAKKKNFFVIENLSASNAFSTSESAPFIWNRGGDFFIENFTGLAITKSETLKGFGDYIGLAERGYMPVFKENFSWKSMPQGMRAMSLSGRHPGFFRSGSGRSDALKFLSVAPWPRDRSNLTHINCRNLAAASSSKNLKQAAVFLKWLISEENLKEFCGRFFVFPCRKSVFEDMEHSDKFFSVYRDLCLNVKMLPNTSVFPTLETLLDRMFAVMAERILNKDYAPDFLLKELIMIQGEVEYLLSIY